MLLVQKDLGNELKTCIPRESQSDDQFPRNFKGYLDDSGHAKQFIYYETMLLGLKKSIM